MSAKIRKVIWLILAVQMFFLHYLMLDNLGRLDHILFKIITRLNLPFKLYTYRSEFIIGGWLLGGVIVFVYQMFKYVAFRNTCYRKMKLVKEESVTQYMQDASEEIGINLVKNIYSCKEVHSPFVLGFRKPILMLPETEYDKMPLKMIFLHEYHHIKSHDNVYKLVFLFTQSVLWYQPLAYLLRQIGVHDIEVACDESVVKDKSMEERGDYGQMLIDSLKWDRKECGDVWSTYFYNNKSVMQARINAVMKKERKWDGLAIVGVVILLCETLIWGYSIADKKVVEYQEYQEAKAPINIYEGYDVPPSFTKTAIENMRFVLDQYGDSGFEYPGEDYVELEDIKEQAVGPWQVRTRRDYYGESTIPLLERYLYYYQDQERGSLLNLEEAYSTMFTVSYEEKIAGNKEECVVYIIGKQSLFEEDISTAIENGWAVRVNKSKDNQYAYYCLALHIKKVHDNIYELMGVAKGEDALDALNCGKKIPKMDLMIHSANIYRIGTDTKGNKLLEVALDGVNWEKVPISLWQLFERGDGMDGALTTVQDKSVQANEHKVIFAFGGSTSVPVSVTYLDEDGTWKQSQVTSKYNGVRRLFVSFPEDSLTGYLVLTTDRVMWNEGSILFKTVDGGATWTEVGSAGPNYLKESHSLTTGGSFITKDIGFVTIRSSAEPELWRTEDGGKVWQQVVFSDMPEYFTMAYPPKMEEGVLKLYISMEEYSEYGGEKALYTSNDMGESWEYEGQVIRK